MMTMMMMGFFLQEEERECVPGTLRVNIQDEDEDRDCYYILFVFVYGDINIRFFA